MLAHNTPCQSSWRDMSCLTLQGCCLLVAGLSHLGISSLEHELLEKVKQLNMAS